MNEHKSCRRTSAYILAGEGAMLARRPFGFAQLHSFVDRAQNFKVGFAQRILCRPGCGGAAFDFIDIIEKFHRSSMLTACGLFGQLHDRRTQGGNCSLFATNHRGNRVMGGLHHERSEVFGALWTTALVPGFALFVVRLPRSFTTTVLLSWASYWSCGRARYLFGHSFSFQMPNAVFSVSQNRGRSRREQP